MMEPSWYRLSGWEGAANVPTVTAVDVKGDTIQVDGQPNLDAPIYFDMDKSLPKLNKLPTIGAELVIDDKSLSAIQNELTICSGIQIRSGMLRCRQRFLSNRRLVPGFNLLFGTKEWQVLDSLKAKVRRVRGHALTVNHWAIDTDLVPPLDLFMAETNKWLVSWKFVELIKDHRFTGFCFHEVETT